MDRKHFIKLTNLIVLATLFVCCTKNEDMLDYDKPIILDSETVSTVAKNVFNGGEVFFSENYNNLFNVFDVDHGNGCVVKQEDSLFVLNFFRFELQDKKLEVVPSGYILSGSGIELYKFFKTLLFHASVETRGEKLLDNLIFKVGTVSYIWNGTNTSGGNIWGKKITWKYGEGYFSVGGVNVYVKVFPGGGVEFDEQEKVDQCFLYDIAEFVNHINNNG